jgi:hypothetical protein
LGNAGGADQCTGVDLVDSRETNLVGIVDLLEGSKWKW